MARRKISRRMPPLRQVVPGSQGINNYNQANIDQNQAASFNQQFGAGAYTSAGGGGGKYNQAALNAAGINQNWGANNANTSQNKVTGATTDLNNSFQATTIPGSTHWNTGVNQLAAPDMVVDTGQGFGLNKGGNATTTNKKGINTFSSEVDPADKTEFKNEVVNEVMSKVGPSLADASPQNKLEELYKPS